MGQTYPEPLGKGWAGLTTLGPRLKLAFEFSPKLGFHFGTPNYEAPQYNLYPKGAHNFENNPFECCVLVVEPSENTIERKPCMFRSHEGWLTAPLHTRAFQGDGWWRLGRCHGPDMPLMLWLCRRYYRPRFLLVGLRYVRGRWLGR